MFKKGDIVVFIDGVDLNEYINKQILLNNLYVIDEMVYYENKIDGVILKDISAIISSNRFILLTEFRKKKINKIINKISNVK